MEVVALVATLLILGAVVVLMVRRSHNQWDQTEAMRALRRLAGAPEEPVGEKDEAGSEKR